MATYRPAGQKQINPLDPTGRYSCAAYSGAILADYATVGGVRISGKQLRQMTDEPIPDKASPGLTIPQVAAALRKTNVTLVDKTGESWSSLVTNVKGGRGALINVYYEALPAEYRAQSSPVGGHSMAMTQLDETGLRGLVYDPLRGNPMWIPLTHLNIAMTAWAKKVGSGGVVYGTTRVVPKVVA